MPGSRLGAAAGSSAAAGKHPEQQEVQECLPGSSKGALPLLFLLQGWPLASLRQYIKWARTAGSPSLSEDAQGLLSAYYQLRRQHEARQGSRTTVRMLESLVRVAQAHARLMARPQVGGSACLQPGGPSGAKAQCRGGPCALPHVLLCTCREAWNTLASAQTAAL